MSEQAGGPTLYVIGWHEWLSDPGIGLCGSRDASPEGLSIARSVGRAAAHLEVPLVSGYARGVDTAGHVAAIEAGGLTTAVLAEGVSTSRGFRLRRDYHGLIEPLEQMTIVSQFPPNTRWRVWNAMKRNQTICALSQVMVAIEPGETGGTLNAAQEAIKRRKQLIVVWPQAIEVPSYVAALSNELGVQLARNERDAVTAIRTAITAPEREPSMFESAR